MNLGMDIVTTILVHNTGIASAAKRQTTKDQSLGVNKVKILIAIDQSPCSDTAVSAVVNRSWPTDSSFEVLHVVDTLVSQFSVTDARTLRAMVEADKDIANYTQKVVDDKIFQLAAIFGKSQVRGSVMEGPIAETIVQKAHAMGADLIVLGSHGRRGLDRLFLGSVAEKVATMAPCSVEIVKDKSHDLPTPSEQVETKMIMEAHH